MNAYPPQVALAALTRGARFCVLDLETDLPPISGPLFMLVR
jgi:hypothetical protein